MERKFSPSPAAIEAGGYLIALALVLSLLVFWSLRHQSSVGGQLACENAEAARIEETRAVTVQDLDAIEAFCSESVGGDQ